MTGNNFFIIFILTVIITRVLVFLFPISSPTFGKFRIHHYMYGIFGIILGLFFQSLIIYAVGWGLFIDELTYLLMRGKTHKDNYSKISLTGTLLFIVIILIFKDYLVLPF